MNLGQRECSSNESCGKGYYCGSDFSCHEMPTIEKTVVQNNLIVPSIIIGIAIIIAAFVMKNGLGFLRVKRNNYKHSEEEHHSHGEGHGLKAP
ncbi:hypothetical protein J4212_07910 [Candidatus Woesearchaeota archaeon]|nr:hypothetical protein [Candidatus Woesearchaeota archaeon]